MKKELENLKSNIEIMNLIKYCQGYIKLVNPSFNRFRITTDSIDSKYLSTNILNSGSGEEEDFEINLPEFYEYDPKDVPQDLKEEYDLQKSLALQLEQISNRFKISEYTKQINLNFGYFKVELPEPEIDEYSEDEEKAPVSKKIKNDVYPLFSIPIEITLGRKISIKLQDVNIIPNIGFLFDVLGEEKFYSFSDFINRQEIEGNLRLPIESATVKNIWEELKTKLKLSNAIFDENSFDPSFFVISLSGKSNFFLEQDFNELLQLDEADFDDSSLNSWNSDEDLSLDDPVNERDGELFFPFNYNKDQVGVLSAIKNRACIVEGPPGTGKSVTIANILCHLAANGKKVLFLSQKAQAIKVVKDYLKELNVENLYGYIPNRFSSLYNSEEEKDSASNSLQSIQQYINSLNYSNGNDTITDPRIKKFEYRDEINESIGIQRKIFEAYKEKSELDGFDISLDNYENFNNASDEDLRSIIKLNQESSDLKDKLDLYYRNNSQFIIAKNKLCENVGIDSNGYSAIIEDIINNMPQKAFERNGFLDPLKKIMIKKGLKRHSDKLPKEIYDNYESILDEKGSRAEKIKALNDLRDFFDFKEKSALLEIKQNELENKIDQNGLSKVCFEKFIKIVNSEKDGFQKVRKFGITSAKIESLKNTNPNEINEYLHKINYKEKDYIAFYLRNIINKNLTEITGSAAVKGMLNRIASSLKKSKKAYKTFDKFKSEPTNFYVMREAVPIWIMDLEDVSRLIPLEKNLFDYVILDEASQCNIAYALPAMYRAQRAVFVGDSEQMRDDSIKFKTNQSLEILGKKFNVPDFLQIKPMGDAVQSIMDIGYKRGFTMKPLTYHYRSPRELIGFSNDNFYAKKNKKLKVINSNYVTYKDTNKVLLNHVVEPTKELDISSKSNIAEARYICNLIEELKKDPKTKNSSIGVLSFFGDQATLLRNMIKDENIKVSIVEGIQGDQKDIMIYSFVITDPSQKKMYVPLTSEGGEKNKELNEGRVNVAFSRARQQVHCVTSIPLEKWPEGIWIKRYLEYVENNGEINFFDTKLSPFDSKFEEDFFEEVLRAEFGKEFIIQNQVESCGFKIDFVITETETGKKLAIECDGPTHFVDEGQEIYVENDFERQSVLESAGWTFYRVNYADWINKNFKKDIFIKDIQGFFNFRTPMVMTPEFEEPKEEKTLILGSLKSETDV